MAFQTTLKHRMSCAGVGLHTGARVQMTLIPAPVDSGLRFRRADITDRDNMIEARFDRVIETGYGTVIANDAGVSIATVEHVLSALAGLGIDNALIEVDGPEVPIMDGSSAPFTFLIECAGFKTQNRPRRYLRILEAVEVRDDDKSVALLPSDNFSVAFDIDFEAAVIGVQSFEVDVTPAAYKAEVARARTFGFLHEVDYLTKRGLARGASLDNAVVVADGKVLNRGGVRFGDEFVRHKVLDAIGDLALAGLPILGAYRGSRAGHGLNNRLLHALFAQDDAFEVVAPPMARAGHVAHSLEAAVA